MENGIKPIPAFYACYLLRSTQRHSSLYVGSTPDPVRRLRQHNGQTQGGAVRTSRDSLRPWEMTCLVTGFPSKIAALQFEWAWQNAHVTRHITADNRITQMQVKTKVSMRTGHIRKKVVKPRLSLNDRMANLNVLLQATSFRHWPLNVVFYNKDVHKIWLKWATTFSEKINEHINISLDLPVENAVVDEDVVPIPQGIAAIPVDYHHMKSAVAKSQQLIDNGQQVSCKLCKSSLPSDGAGMLVCPSADCSFESHMTCLSKHFLSQDGSGSNMMPVGGRCPTCSQELKWVELVKDLTLRMRGQSEMKKLFKEPKTRKRKVTKTTNAAGKAVTVAVEELVDDADEDAEDQDDEEPLIDEWHRLTDSSQTSYTAAANLRDSPSKINSFRPRDVVEDSDWDDADVIE